MNIRSSITETEREDYNYFFHLGMKMKAKDEIETAISIFQKLAMQGFPDAQCELASCYKIQGEDHLVFYWYQQAANQGHPHGQYRLSNCYRDGTGVDIDRELSLKFLTKAALQGHAYAQFNLAVYYSYQADEDSCAKAKKDELEKKAFELFKLAAQKGHGYAQCELAYCYYTGQGTKKDFALAYQWAQQHINNINNKEVSEEILYLLGLMYIKGKGVNKNPSLAFDYFEKAAAKGHEQATLWVDQRIGIDAGFIYSQLNNSRDYYLPCLFPSRVSQKESNCGSVAFASAINFTNQLPYPLFGCRKTKKRVAKNSPIKMEWGKNDNSDVVLECLKNKVSVQYRSSGPQFEINSFQELANFYGISHCEATVLQREDGSDYSKKEYRKKICQAFRENKVLILSCDEDEKVLMPANRKGEGAHWVLGLGYWRDEIDGRYYLAVLDHNHICKWSINKLYKSNKQLPLKNPHPGYQDRDLSQFRLSMFQVPVKGERKVYDSRVVNENDANDSDNNDRMSIDI